MIGCELIFDRIATAEHHRIARLAWNTLDPVLTSGIGASVLADQLGIRVMRCDIPGSPFDGDLIEQPASGASRWYLGDCLHNPCGPIYGIRFFLGAAEDPKPSWWLMASSTS